MFAKSVVKGSLGKLQKVLLVAAALVVLMAGLPVGQAYAWSYANLSGRPGSVGIPTIYIGDLLMPWGSTQFTLYGNTGPVAYRSPASTGAQQVSAVYTVQTLVGSSWVNTATTGVFYGQISAAQGSYRFPAPYIQPVASRGIFRVSWSFVWSTSTGVSLGATNVISHLASDHVCVTPHRLCKSYPGYFQTGGYRTGTW